MCIWASHNRCRSSLSLLCHDAIPCYQKAPEKNLQQKRWEVTWQALITWFVAFLLLVDSAKGDISRSSCVSRLLSLLANRIRILLHAVYMAANKFGIIEDWINPNYCHRTRQHFYIEKYKKQCWRSLKSEKVLYWTVEAWNLSSPPAESLTIQKTIMSALDNGMRLHNHDFYKYFNLNGFYIDSVLFKHQLWCYRSSASCSQVNCLTNQRLQLVQLG